MRLAALAILCGCQPPPHVIARPAPPPTILPPDAGPGEVCGSGPTVKGIDVSAYQGEIDWGAVRGDGVEFAFVRVGDGLAPDAMFARNWEAARAQGIVRGAYQFFRPGQDATAQAKLVLDAIGDGAGDLPPVIDVEATDGLAPAELEAQVRTWIDLVTAALGRAPIVYAGFYTWRDRVRGADFTSSPLWHAQYTDAPCAKIAPPWRTWAVWQFTNKGRVGGVRGAVDLDRFNGTRRELDALRSRRAE